MIKKTIIRIFYFYRDGFREMTIGRTLWAIILIKLFVMFFILKLFFFPSFLSGKSISFHNFLILELTDRMAE